MTRLLHRFDAALASATSRLLARLAGLKAICACIARARPAPAWPCH